MTTKQDITCLECTSGNSNKFYNVETYQNDKSQFVVRCHWGRIGTKGQYQDKGIYHSQVRADSARASLIRQKQSKGYKKVTKSQAKSSPGKGKAQDKPVTKKEVSLDRFSDLWE